MVWFNVWMMRRRTSFSASCVSASTDEFLIVRHQTQTAALMTILCENSASAESFRAGDQQKVYVETMTILPIVGMTAVCRFLSIKRCADSMKTCKKEAVPNVLMKRLSS